MKKQLVLLVMMVFLFSLVSADLLTINNVKQYDNSSKTATIKESALGKEIVNATLNTPQVFNVGYGGTFKVAEFTLVNLYDTDYQNILDGMKIINLKTGREESKTITYKYKTLGIRTNNVTAKSDCKYEDVSKNGTFVDNCKVSYKLENETYEIWEPLSSFDILKGQSITVGLFTYVNKGDVYEWIPQIAGKSVEEWAVWNSTFETSMIAYYQMNETTGTNMSDSFADKHATINLAQLAQPGKIDYGYSFNNNATYYVTTPSTLGMISTYTITGWFRANTINALNYLWSPNGANLGLYYDAAGLSYYDGSAQVQVLNGMSTKYYNFYALIVNGNNHTLVWYNGQNGSKGISTATLTKVNINSLMYAQRSGSWPIDARMDEMGLWNTTLTFAMIDDLWNNNQSLRFRGATAENPTVFLLSPTNATTVTIPSQSYVCNATVSDGLKNASLIVDGVSVATNTTAINTTNYTFDYTLTTTGLHTWTCTVFSNSNLSTTPANRHITYDFTTTVVSPTNTNYSSTSVPLNIASNDTLQSINYSLNGGANTTFTPNTTLIANYGPNNVIVHSQSNYTVNRTTQVYFYINGTTVQLNTPTHNQAYALSQSFLYNGNGTVYGGNVTNVSLWTDTGGWSRKNTSLINNSYAYNDQNIVTSTANTYANMKSITLANNYLTNVTFELRIRFAGPTAYGIIEYVYANGTRTNSTEQSTTGTSYTNKTFINPALNTEVTTVNLYLKNSDGATQADSQSVYFYNYAGETINKSWNYTYGSAQSIIWNMEVCGQNGICALAGSNRTVIISPADITLNSITYNATSLVGNNESVIANITANTSLTSVVLYYDGFTYNMTNSSGIWSTTINLNTSHIGTNNFYLNYTFNGAYSSSPTYQQVVSQVTWTLCNTTYPVQFLNITFADESNGTVLYGEVTYSNWSYYLSGSTDTRTYEYTNTTDSLRHSFCGYPGTENFLVTPYIQYAATDYPQRIWSPGQLTYNNTTTVKVLYLLSTSTGQYVTFQLVNTADQVLEGVYVNATRTISGTQTVVGSGYTSSAGIITFWLNPDFSHNFCFSKSGYDTYCTSFAPTLTEYTVSLTGGTSTTEDYTRGIRNSFSPKIATNLYNDTTYTFWYNLTSSYWEIDSFGFNLRLANGTTFSGGTSTNEGTAATKNFNTKNQSIVYMDYYWVINGNYSYGTNYWTITNTEYSGWSVKTFFTDMNTYFDSGFFGLDDFGRYLIVFIVLFFTIGIMSYKYSLTSPLAISITTFLVIFFFDVVTGIMPTIRGITNLPTYLAGILVALLVLKEAMEG